MTVYQVCGLQTLKTEHLPFYQFGTYSAVKKRDCLSQIRDVNEDFFFEAEK